MLTEERVRELIREELVKALSNPDYQPQLPAVSCYYMANPVMHDDAPPTDVSATITYAEVVPKFTTAAPPIIGPPVDMAKALDDAFATAPGPGGGK